MKSAFDNIFFKENGGSHDVAIILGGGGCLIIMLDYKRGSGFKTLGKKWLHNMWKLPKRNNQKNEISQENVRSIIII